MNELALFAGAGGGIWGGVLLGWRTVCAVERDIYAATVLAQRQNHKELPPFPIWSDITTFDGRPWYGCVDVVSGGFPCQDISVAGSGLGIQGKRSGLWNEMARVIGEVRPKFAFVENSPNLVNRGLGSVLGDLADMGYDARWGVFSACSIGAPHMRKRMFILAYTGCHRLQARKRIAIASTAKRSSSNRQKDWNASQCNDTGHSWWSTEPQLARVDDGVAYRSHRVRAIGNGQVPAVAAMAFRTLHANAFGGS